MKPKILCIQTMTAQTAASQKLKQQLVQRLQIRDIKVSVFDPLEYTDDYLATTQKNYELFSYDYYETYLAIFFSKCMELINTQIQTPQIYIIEHIPFMFNIFQDIIEDTQKYNKAAMQIFTRYNEYLKQNMSFVNISSYSQIIKDQIQQKQYPAGKIYEKLLEKDDSTANRLIICQKMKQHLADGILKLRGLSIPCLNLTLNFREDINSDIKKIIKFLHVDSIEDSLY